MVLLWYFFKKYQHPPPKLSHPEHPPPKLSHPELYVQYLTLLTFVPVAAGKLCTFGEKYTGRGVGRDTNNLRWSAPVVIHNQANPWLFTRPASIIPPSEVTTGHSLCSARDVELSLWAHWEATAGFLHSWAVCLSSRCV